MILALLLASCNFPNQCNAGVVLLGRGAGERSQAACGPSATATIQEVGDAVYAVCSCPCDDPPTDDLREPERIEHR